MNLMKIVVIDPGHTAGICMAIYDKFAANMLVHQLYSWEWNWDEFPTVFTGYNADMYIVEGIPHFNPHPAQARRYDRLVSALAGAYIIDPPQWKPIAKAQKWSHPEADTDHEKDAYNILRFWHLMTYRRDMGVIRITHNGA